VAVVHEESAACTACAASKAAMAAASWQERKWWGYFMSGRGCARLVYWLRLDLSFVDSRKTPGHGEKCTKTAKLTSKIFKFSKFVQKSPNSPPGASQSGKAPIDDAEFFRRLDRAGESGRAEVPGEALLAGPDGLRARRSVMGHSGEMNHWGR
jgi:hypothetical protein